MKPQISTFDRGPCLKRILAIAIVSSSCLLATVLLSQSSGLAHGQTRTSFWVRSSSFSNGRSIPARYTCDAPTFRLCCNGSLRPPAQRALPL